MLYTNSFRRIMKSLVEADVALSLWTIEECPLCGGIANQHQMSIGSYEDLYPVLDWYWDDSEACDYNLDIDEISEDWYEITLSYPSEVECNFCEMYELNTVHAYEYAELYQGEAWEGSVFHHGVQAYNQVSDPEIAMCRIEEIHDCYDMEICTSTEMIGPYGVSVYGDIQVASKCDLWSEIDPDDGSRMFNEDSLDLVTEPEDLYEFHTDHNEIIVTNTVIEAIWCKDWVDPKIKDRLIKLSKKLGVFFIEASKRK